MMIPGEALVHIFSVGYTHEVHLEARNLFCFVSLFIGINTFVHLFFTAVPRLTIRRD